MENGSSVPGARTAVRPARPILILLGLLLPVLSLANPLPVGASDFMFSGWAGKDFKVRVYVPENHTDLTPVVIVMHGASRDAERYFNDWAPLGEAHGYIIVVPEFSAADFSRSARYNLGFVFSARTDRLRPEEEWTFSAIEPLFDEIVDRLGGQQDGYSIYGHSAGSQFVHRYLFYKPDARVHRYIAANAGWYTLPLPDVDYPYGLQDSEVPGSRLADIFSKDLVLLLGREDTDPNANKLRQTPEAREQGPNRLARGITMFRVAAAKAEELGAEFNWQLMLVPGADHDNAKMAPAAATLIE